MSAKRLNLAICLLLSLLACVPYLNSLDGGAVFDGELLVEHDPRIREVTAANLSEIVSRAYYYPDRDTNLYRPLATLSYLVNYAVLGNGQNALGYHVVNVILHGINTWLVFLLMGSVFRNRLHAVLAAAIFAVHPVATEAVTNIAGRPDLMAGTVVLSALVIFAKMQGSEGHSGLLACAGLFGLGAMGMLSKESAVVLVPLMFLYDLSFRPERLRNWRSTRLAYWAAAYGCVVAWAIRHQVLSRLEQSSISFVDNPLVSLSFWDSRLTAATVIVRYFLLLIWPDTLSCDYSYGQIVKATPAEGLIAVAIILGILGLLAYSYRRNRAVFFWGIWFFFALFPVSNVGRIIGTVMAERFLYLPLVGFAGCLVACLGWAFDRVFADNKRRVFALATVFAMLVLSLGVRTFVRNADWDSTTTLFESAMDASPQSFKPYHTLAVHLWMKGDQNATNLLRAIELEQHATAVLDALPPERNLSGPFAMLGNLWSQYGDVVGRQEPNEAAPAYQRAVAAFERGAEIDKSYNDQYRRAELARGVPPDQIANKAYAELWIGLGEARSRLGMHSEALDAKLHAAKAFPTDPEIAGFVSEQLQRMNRSDEALVWASRSLLTGQTPNNLARFVTYYKAKYPNECPAAASNSLNISCALVREVVCSGERDLLKAIAEAHLPSLERRYARTSPARAFCTVD